MFFQYLRLIRITHWVKNLFVFVPLIYSRHVFETDYLILSVAGFFAFSLTSSFIYVINDMYDVEADRQHPRKKHRPLAAGTVSFRQAGWLAAAIVVLLAALLVNLDPLFAVATGGYLLLNVFYSYKLKHIVLLDIFSIAAGFMLRVVSGAFVINVETSNWLLLTTMFISLYLAVMKRSSEYRMMTDEEKEGTREVLKQYSKKYLNQMVSVSASGVVLSYAMYSVAPRTVSLFGTDNLILTIPFVVFGILRYMYIAYEEDKGENPVEALVTDMPSIINILLYLAATILIIYNYI